MTSINACLNHVRSKMVYMYLNLCKQEGKIVGVGAGCARACLAGVVQTGTLRNTEQLRNKQILLIRQ